MRAALAMLLVCGALACSKGDGGGADGVLAAWKKAGFEPAAFEPVKADLQGDARCHAGAIKGIEATLCELPSVADASRAEAAALATLKETTGLALAEGKLLLVLADRKHADPSGRTMNELARAFRDR